MSVSNELLQEFYALFGDNGGDRLPGNVGVSRTVVNVCQELMQIEDPILFDYFKQWDSRTEEECKPFGIGQLLVHRGQWEGAWALAQLHYDQLLKYEAKNRTRQHKGHPLCNLALVGQAIGSPSLTRHYALLSSAGDVYWEHNDAGLKFGGLAPTILERFESHHQQYVWRNSLRSQLTPFDNKPVYLESFLAGRWFTETYAKHITSLAEIALNYGKPFTEVLLDSVETSSDTPDTTIGARFEAAAGLLLSATPGFEVDSGRKTTDEQIDLVVYYTPEHLAPIGLEPGCGLVECKSSKGRVKAKELRDFGAKCLFHRVRFGILVARAGTTGDSDKFEEPQNAELARRRFQLDGLTVLVLDMNQLRGKSRELRGVQDGLAADYKELVFGRKP
jgi:hypothetical protein